MHWNAPVQLQQLYLGHGLPKYEVKVETMLVFTGAHVKPGLATVLGETPWLFNMVQPKCLRGRNAQNAKLPTPPSPRFPWRRFSPASTPSAAGDQPGTDPKLHFQGLGTRMHHGTSCNSLQTGGGGKKLKLTCGPVIHLS